MSLNAEQKELCRLCVLVGQRRPGLDAVEVSKAVSKLYRIAVSLDNRGYEKELDTRARDLAKSLYGDFLRAEDKSGEGTGRYLYFLALDGGDAIRLG